MRNKGHNPIPAYPTPKKRLGQNFLVDQNITKKIIACAEIRSHQTVLEIGPGVGALTRFLIESAARVIAVEIDPGLVRYLDEAFANTSNLDVRLGDALEFPYDTLPQGTIVVANLPYQVSTPLLFRLLENRSRIQWMVVMLQWEVARRVLAKPGSREYGILSVFTQYFGVPRIVFKVPRTCFRPRPEVDSAVVRFDFPSECIQTQPEEGAFSRIVRVAFGHRRKILSNAFRDAGFTLSDIQPVFQLADIDWNRRAETLTVDEFRTLARAFQDRKGFLNDEFPRS